MICRRRLRDIRFIFMLVILSSLLLFGGSSVDWSSYISEPPELNVDITDILRSQGDKPESPKEIEARVKRFHDMQSSGLAVTNMSENQRDAQRFIDHVNSRFNAAGIRALREMKMREEPVVVKPPDPPINPHNFNYIHNPKQICAENQNMMFLIYVHSGPDNLKRRQIIRQTWGNPHLLALFNSSIIFAIGGTSDPNLQKKLDMEFEEYGDLMQEDYVDSYRNLTYKGISALKWSYQFCKQPLFFMKTDDDIILDVVTMIDHILTKVVPNRGAKKLILCLNWKNMKVMRDPKSKWSLSTKEFAPDYFPPYCSGSAFFLSGDMIPLLYGTALSTPFFWVDDYYITGALVKKLSIKHESLDKAYLLNGKEYEKRLKAEKTPTLMIFHMKDYNIFFKIWHMLMKRHQGLTSFIHSFSTVGTREIQSVFHTNSSLSPLESSSSITSNTSPVGKPPASLAAVATIKKKQPVASVTSASNRTKIG